MSVHASDRQPPSGGKSALHGWRSRWAVKARGLSRSIVLRASSSLTRRIVVLNLGGLLALLIGFLYLNQFRAGLIDARMQSLQTQGEIIAAAIAGSASVETDGITIDPDKLLQLAPGQTYGLGNETTPSLEFSINPELIGPVLRRLVSPTKTRARVYDRDGYLLLDTRALSQRSNILRFDLPQQIDETAPTFFERVWTFVRTKFGSSLPQYDEAGTGNGRAYPEVQSALSGFTQTNVMLNVRGETIISVSVPVQKFRVVRGALLLSTQGGDIDKIIASERWAIIRLFVIFAGIMLFLSLLLANTIAEPVRRLAAAAERVRRGIKARQEIPDFSGRADEIGELSGALREMTQALYRRMDAIESFAADVAHELKNPLTSLRSAVEILPRVQADEKRQRLLDVIQHDVKRLDRLISDISDASRLDAELARADAEPVDMERLLKTVVDAANQIAREDGIVIHLDVAGELQRPRKSYFVLGHDSRLGQVITNLIDNARSFSPKQGNVRLALRLRPLDVEAGSAKALEILVDDDGPGIPDHAFERIFERFYTDRPGDGFGQNSGLGLSISRQIIEAHGGSIKASNRLDPVTGAILGARFIVTLPVL